MMQLLFGFTVVFVFYVLYEVFKTVSQVGSAPPPAASSEAVTTAVPVTEAMEASPQVALSLAVEGERSTNLRNPATGEVAAIPTNYRFAKKWIKEALVAEGLLERVYKPNELDEAASEKVREALEKFKDLAKYQA